MPDWAASQDDVLSIIYSISSLHKKVKPERAERKIYYEKRNKYERGAAELSLLPDRI